MFHCKLKHIAKSVRLGSVVMDGGAMHLMYDNKHAGVVQVWPASVGQFGFPSPEDITSFSREVDVYIDDKVLRVPGKPMPRVQQRVEV